MFVKAGSSLLGFSIWYRDDHNIISNQLKRVFVELELFFDSLITHNDMLFNLLIEICCCHQLFSQSCNGQIGVLRKDHPYEDEERNRWHCLSCKRAFPLAISLLGVHCHIFGLIKDTACPRAPGLLRRGFRVVMRNQCPDSSQNSPCSESKLFFSILSIFPLTW